MGSRNILIPSTAPCSTYKKHFFQSLHNTYHHHIYYRWLPNGIHTWAEFFGEKVVPFKKLKCYKKMCFHQKKIFNYNVTDVIIALKNMHIYHTLERKQTLDHQKTRFFPRFCPTIYVEESFKKISLFFFDYHDNLFPRKNNRVVCWWWLCNL